MPAEESRAEVQRQLIELLDFPREDLGTEIKDWLPLHEKISQANLSIALIALANHGGGYILFGFREDTAGWSASGRCPHPQQHYAQDAINNILKAYAEPVFACDVHHIASSGRTAHVVVRVPGGHRVPIRSKKDGPPRSRLKADVYYIRRPGPESAPPGSGREWDDLLRRCLTAQREELLASFRNIVAVIGASPMADAIGTSALEAWEAASTERLDELRGESA
jgi:hypothetical protein